MKHVYYYDENLTLMHRTSILIIFKIYHFRPKFFKNHEPRELPGPLRKITLSFFISLVNGLVSRAFDRLLADALIRHEPVTLYRKLNLSFTNSCLPPLFFDNFWGEKNNERKNVEDSRDS